MINILEKLIKPEKFLLYFGLIFGIIFLFINPPYQSPDEFSHLFKAYSYTKSLSYCDVVTIDNKKYKGHIIPQSFIQIKDAFANLPFHKEERTSIKSILQFKNLDLNKNNEVFYSCNPTSYTFFSYIIFIPIIAILKILNCKPLLMIYILRFCSLLVYLAMAYYAVKITPIKKWLFLVIGSLPMTVYLAASISTDGLTIGFSLLAFAYLLRLYYSETKEEYSIKQLCILCFLFSYLFICKIAYFPLILLFCILPKYKIQNKNRIILFGIATIVTISVTICTWNSLSNIQGCLPASYSETSSIEAIKNFVLNPLNSFVSLIGTLIVRGSFYLASFIGLFGWLDTSIPALAKWISTLIIIFFSIFNFNNEKSISIRDKKIFAISAILTYTIVALMCSMVFGFTPRGLINGIQGRYFTPFILSVLFLFQNNQFQAHEEKQYIFVYFLLNNFVYLSCIYAMLLRYYAA